MAGPPQMQYRPQQAVQGQFPKVSGPSQPEGHFGYQPSTVYQMGQPTPRAFIVRALTTERRAGEKKNIQIKDPNSNKDVTQEILKRHPSGSLTSSTGGTSNNTTPDISGQSNSSSTPHLTPQQQAEANVRAQFAAQVAAALTDTAEEKPRKPEYTIQKAPVSIRAEIDVQEKASGSLTSTSSGSSSSTPPLTSQQQAEANVRAQFAAQVAAKLRDITEEKPRKPEYTIQKAPESNWAELDVQEKKAADKSKNLFGSTATGNCQFSFNLFFLLF